MRRAFLFVAVMVLATAPMRAQSPATSQFQITSIQISTRPQPGMRGGILRGDRYELRNAKMVDLIRTAYDVQAERVTGGPSWLEWNRYDVAALAPEGTTAPVLRDMLKALLAERFQLRVRQDTATVPGFALKVSATHKLRPATGPGSCQGQVTPGPNGAPLQTIACTGTTLAQIVEQLPRSSGPYFPPGTLMVDETGLTGLWDFELKYTPWQALPQAGADGITIQKGLEEIGITLEPRELKAPAVIVESVNASFSPNAPDIATRMPPPPSPTFEVADVKPSPAGNTGPRRMQLQPNGQVNGNNVPLKPIIGLAWTLPNPDYIVGPAWLDTNTYEIIGRVYATTNPNAQVQQDEDIARKMLQNLIIERFKMKYHMEDRPMTAYVLKADNVRMSGSDPSRRTRCFEGAPPGTPAATRPPQFARLVTCQNVTMAQFGTWLPSIAGGYTQQPARDLTGLPDGYDFTLNFSTIQQVQGARPDAAGAPTGAALDPTGALSLLDAMRTQLGIRMEEEKRMVPVLVIDSISPDPTAN